MQIPLGASTKIKINQTETLPTPGKLASIQALLILLPARDTRTLLKSRWPDFPYADVLKKRLRQRPPGGDKGITLVTELDTDDAGSLRVVLGQLAKDADAFTRLSRARQLAAEIMATGAGSVMLLTPGFDAEQQTAAAEALLLALLTAACPLPSFKQTPPPTTTLKRIELYGLQDSLNLARIHAEVQGNHLARWLTALPPNHLTPALYRKQVASLARGRGWSSKFYDRKALEKEQAGAFLAVAQASAANDAGILHLAYRPAGKRRGDGLALVGKGICFDTGGVNIKNARGMNGMHQDMQGSAVALGSFLALSELKVDFPVDCWLALAENHVGPKAYKPNDVITAANGTSIEIIHTDAEGRMVLADTLVLAGRNQPELIIDYATLTGSCVQALSDRYSGAFSNRDKLLPAVIEAGRDSGERIWPFPMDADFDEALDSDIADIKQCIIESEADHILAARFLKRFVPDTCAWLHIDLSSGSHKGGLAHVPTDITGFGVRFTLNLLLKQRGVD